VMEPPVSLMKLNSTWFPVGWKKLNSIYYALK
jgi:hypothetical protein